MKQYYHLFAGLLALMLLASACGPISDITSPEVVIQGGPPDGGSVNFDAFSFPIYVTDNVSKYPDLTIRIRFDNSDWSEWGKDMAPTYNLVPDGTHTFAVQAKDLAGNLSEIMERKFQVTSVSCNPMGVINPITGKMGIAETWAEWNGSSKTYGKMTVALTTTGQLIHTDPHNTTWMFKERGYVLVIISIGQAIPNTTVNGLVYILSCQNSGKNYMFEQLESFQLTTNQPFLTPIP